MHTNNTSHYNLPQFIGSDIPNPLTDWNDSMQDIDTAMYEIKTQADEIAADIVQDETDISDLQSQANLTDDNITLLNQQTTAARTAATDAQDAANRNATNITALQQSVANNRTSITQYNNRFNENVPFAFAIEEVEDPDNPGQTIEKYGYYTNDDPSQFIPFGEAPLSSIAKIGYDDTVLNAYSNAMPSRTLNVAAILPNNYNTFTDDNFMIVPNAHTGYMYGSQWSINGGNLGTQYHLSKSYDATTGILTYDCWNENVNPISYHPSTYLPVTIYLIASGISNIPDLTV